MTELRVFDYIGRSMERLGFLKRLLKRVSATATSNLENLGKDLVTSVSQKIRVPITLERLEYINSRVRGKIFQSTQKDIDLWLKNEGNPPEVSIEIQDLYLADPLMPSQVGRLIADNWRRYPALGTNLGLIRKGTYSITTRGVSFLNLISLAEIGAFIKYDQKNNPLLISRPQGLLLHYSLLENDGEVVIPLWNNLKSSNFTEKEAGDLLPSIYRKTIARHRKSLLPIDIRERLDVLEDTATSVEKVAQSEKSYGGTSPRDTAIRPRLEPYVDIGLFSKPNPKNYEYEFTNEGILWTAELSGYEESPAIGEFLASRFFHTAAQAWQIQARELTTPDEIIPYFQRAAKVISSSSGYTPIEELALLSGIWALDNDQNIIEPGIARESLIAYQKLNPYKVRFTVDRSGVLAHARFMDDSANF